MRLDHALEAFTTALEAKNCGQATITVYRADLSQFFSWLHENSVLIGFVSQVERIDITDYPAHLGQPRNSHIG